MAKSRQYDLVTFKNAIAEVGASPQAIADYVGCKRGTVYRYIEKYPELKAAFEGVGKVGKRPQYPKQVFEAAITGSRGIKSTVAARVGCSRQTVDNMLEAYPELKEMLDAERSKLVSAASSALAADVENAESDGHQKAYLFVLKTFGKEEGFVERQEITGADGVALFDADDLRLAAAIGLDVSEAVAQFKAMLRLEAQKRGVS